MVMWLYCPSPSPHDFPGLPGQVPPDHMCHLWPISRVGPRAQNFALKSQISCQTNLCGLCGPYFRCGRLWGMRSADFFFGGKLRSCAPGSAVFFYGLCFFSFSAELHYTNCVPDFCLKKPRRNLVWFSLGFLLKKWAEFNITKCAPEFCWSWICFCGGNP